MAAQEMEPDPPIDELVNSTVVSVRYALITQLLGKIAAPARDLRIIQSSAGGPGAWDARSFSTAVVVPWVADNQNVIGSSSEPYVSKPLRRERLELNMHNVRSRAAWNKLVHLLDQLEHEGEETVRVTFQRVLKSLVRRLATQSFAYAIPQRISLGRLQTIIDKFLSEPSGGLRPLAVTAALIQTASDAYSIFSKFECQGINESDSASDVPGDIVCYDTGHPPRISLCVEVKDQSLTLTHVKASSLKAKRTDLGLESLLFVVPSVVSVDREDIADYVAREWASGMNVHITSLRKLVATWFLLLDESWRVRFVREIGEELDIRHDQPSRKAWHDLLLVTEESQ